MKRNIPRSTQPKDALVEDFADILRGINICLWEMHYDSRDFAKRVERLLDILDEEIPEEEQPRTKRKYTKRHKKWNKKAK